MTAEPRAPTEAPQEERHTLRAIRAGLRRAIVDNAALKFVALVLSVTLFILVNTGEDHVISAYIKVSYTMPEERVLVSEPVDQVRVTIKGPWRRVKRFDEREVDPIIIDLTGVTGNQVTVSEDAVRLPGGLELEAIDPPVIPIEFEPRETITVPVSVQTAGTPERGYKVDQLVVTPAEVTIRGAASVLAEVKAVRTLELSLTGRSESYEAALSLIPPRRFVEVLDSDTVEVQVSLVEEIIRRDLGEAAIEIRPGADLATSVDGRFAVSPETVSVVAHGPRLRVEQIESITPVIKVYANDFGTRRREAAVEIVGAPEGVGLEINPRIVTVRLRR